MPKEEWGTKRVCLTTGKRFFDLNKNPIVSPYTGEILEMEAGKSRMIAADAEDAETLKAKKAEEDAEDITLDGDESNDADLGDDVLDDEDDEDTVSLDEIADVPANDDD